MSAYPPKNIPAYTPTPAPRLPTYCDAPPPPYVVLRCYTFYKETPWNKLAEKGMWEQYCKDKNEIKKRHEHLKSLPPIYDESFQKTVSLKVNQLGREAVYMNAKMIIDDLITDKNGNRQKKGIRHRTLLKSYLEWICFHTFETEEEENDFIGEWGDGIWDITKLANAFKIGDLGYIADIARLFGADVPDGICRPISS
jgi:hypothetical protein